MPGEFPIKKISCFWVAGALWITYSGICGLFDEAPLSRVLMSPCRENQKSLRWIGPAQSLLIFAPFSLCCFWQPASNLTSPYKQDPTHGLVSPTKDLGSFTKHSLSGVSSFISTDLLLLNFGSDYTNIHHPVDFSVFPVGSYSQPIQQGCSPRRGSSASLL